MAIMDKLFSVEIILHVVIVFSASTLVSGSYDCTDCIIIDQKYGDDNLCFKSNTTTSTIPCETISHALSLNDTEVVLHGDYLLNQTVIVSRVSGLTIRSDGSLSSTIYCALPTAPNDTGSGLVFESVSNLTISNIAMKGCGSLQLSTTIRNGSNVLYRCALYIINSTNIHIRNIMFLKGHGRGLSFYDVDGYVKVEDSVFSENIVPANESNMLFGGGGMSIEFTYCSPGYPNCQKEENTHNSRSKYIIQECVFEHNVASITTESDVIQFKN